MTSNADPAPSLVKDILGPHALIAIADAGEAVSPLFDRAAFLDAGLDGLDRLSIMERVRHVAAALRVALPDDYATALAVIRAMGPRLTHGFQAMAVTEFVGRYGLEDFDRSMEALADLTRFGSAEFAIRPFLALDAERTLATMTRWAKSKDEHVRRLASEGSRPRLPWAARVPALKADPTLAIPMLETLRADPSAYVRRSVANHLNDIAKDRPDWLIGRLAGWAGDEPHTRGIIRHALRTLIKKGDPRALALIGVGHGAAVTIGRFEIGPPRIRLGERITIAVDLASLSADSQRLVVDYRIHYARAGGKSAAKVFKLKTFSLAAGDVVALVTSQMIRDFSTRRHYPGRHDVELIVNGRTMANGAFEIVSDRTPVIAGE